MSAAPPRPAAQRIADTEALLRREVDAWVATAGPDGAWMVPLSFVWHNGVLVFGTGAASRTVRNLRVDPRARVGIGPTRDLVIVDGAVELVPNGELPGPTADAFATAAGFDPRTLRDYVYPVLTPDRVQAWREENELAERTIMRGGRWVTSG